MVRIPVHFAALACSSLALPSCSSINTAPDQANPTVMSTPVPPTAGFLSWRLPKTVLESTATFKYKGCLLGPDGRPQLELERSVAVVAKGVPDDNIFGNGAQDSLVQVPISAMSSWLDDRSMAVERAANGTVSKLGASAEDQTAAIVGNVLTSAVKISSIAFGVAPGGDVTAEHARCGDAPKAIKDEMARINGILRNPKTTEQASVAWNLQLADQQKKLDKLTITVTRFIDPGITSPTLPADCMIVPKPKGCPGGPPIAIQASGLIATLLPSADQIKSAGWLVGDATVQANAVKPAAISIFLDFARASPAIVAACVNSAPCARQRTIIDRSTHFRDVAYIPLIVVSGTDPAVAGAAFDLTINGAKLATGLPFAQFGIPRRLPIEAGLFEKLAWTYAFNEFGEPTSASFGSAARGNKASSLLAAGAGSAATIAAQERTADARLDPETLELQAEAARLKARIDLGKLRSEANDMKAKGQLPE